MAGRALLGTLPVELTSFVGRRREVGEVKRLLVDARLVTLTGIGGTGKTRLALRVGGDVRRAFPDGVWFVDLTELRISGLLGGEVGDPQVLAHLVAAVLGLHDRPGVRPLRRLADHLADGQAMLVLDNCEHLLTACAILVDRLLRDCPRLRILTTSREPLGLTAEMIFSVPPLPTPRPGDRQSLAAMDSYESVTLFVTRAQAATPAFGITADNRAAVAEICHRLDGLPLAIELAAARTRVLTPRQIVDRLANRFTVLGRGSRTAPGRQQTLRACVDWSFDLCSKPERMLWARSAVFVGGFELDAVEGICADGDLPAADLLDLLAGLLDKSILVRDDFGGQGEVARYRMLETLRDYGHEQLREAGEYDLLRHRHADWYQGLAARAATEWISHREVYWHARLSREHPNLRAAIEYCLDEPDLADTALHLAMTVPLAYWSRRGLFSEVRRWLDRALAQTATASTIRARALLLDSHYAIIQGDSEVGMRLLDRGEDLARQLGSIVETAYAAYVRGVVLVYRGDLPAAHGLVECLPRSEPWRLLRTFCRRYRNPSRGWRWSCASAS